MIAKVTMDSTPPLGEDSVYVSGILGNASNSLT